MLAVLIVFAIALLQSKDELHAEVTWCTFCCTPNCGGANGGATATPTPSPDAIVAPSGGTHTTIAAAYAAVSCGDLIWVRNGTYNITDVINLNKTCTAGNWLTIQNYPGESPKVVCTAPTASGGNDRVEINGPYHVWDGIEISSCYDGIKNYVPHVKILNSKIHNNIFTGIVNVPISSTLTDVEIAGNTIEANGYIESENCTVGDASNCTRYDDPFNPGNPISVKNIHQIYISNSTCNNIDGVHIHDNVLRNGGGRAFQMNGTEGGDGAPCQADGITNVVFEDNTISNTSWGISGFYGISGVQIINNDFTINSWPVTNDSDHTFIGLWALVNSVITGNTFNSTSSSVRPFNFFDNDSGCTDGGNNDIDFNIYTINTNDWMYNEVVRNDFSSAYTSVTGCGANDTLN